MKEIENGKKSFYENLLLLDFRRRLRISRHLLTRLGGILPVASVHDVISPAILSIFVQFVPVSSVSRFFG